MMTFLAGSHGMGQAQSQFSSGDCSGCSSNPVVSQYPSGPSLDGRPDPIISLPGIGKLLS